MGDRVDVVINYLKGAKSSREIPKTFQDPHYPAEYPPSIVPGYALKSHFYLNSN